jgi:Zn-dependent alcohol dehydrogenase
LIGVVTYPQWVLPRAVEWLDRRRGEYPFEALVSRTFGLVDINSAFAAADRATSTSRLGRAVISMTDQQQG